LYEAEQNEQKNITLHFNNAIQNSMKLIRFQSGVMALGVVGGIIANVVGLFVASVTYIL
jgi:hypothetical protein